MSVFLTIDTELWPSAITPEHYRRAFDRDVLGRVQNSELGALFQAKTFSKHGLIADFFVESLFAECFGSGDLTELVGQLRGLDQGVQLHLHAEWLTVLDRPLLSSPGNRLEHFDEADQATLLRRGLRLLRGAGGWPHAFRAGNFGMSRATFGALQRVGLSIDSSYNARYPISDLEGAYRGMQQPSRIDHVLEFPVTTFVDRPGGVRPVQLTACSSNELEFVLEEAYRQGRYGVVVVLHSFELLDPQRERVDSTALRRFHRLCEYLARHRQRFETRSFSDLRPEEVPTLPRAKPIVSSLPRTLARQAEQALRRLSWSRRKADPSWITTYGSRLRRTKRAQRQLSDPALRRASDPAMRSVWAERGAQGQRKG